METVKCYSWKDFPAETLLRSALEHELHCDPEEFLLKRFMERHLQQKFNSQVALLTVNDIPVGVTLIHGVQYAFYVKPEHRRKGFATLMYNTLKRDYRQEPMTGENYGSAPDMGAYAFFDKIGLPSLRELERRHFEKYCQELGVDRYMRKVS